jgi:hypothetical protein
MKNLTVVVTVEGNQHRLQISCTPETYAQTVRDTVRREIAPLYNYDIRLPKQLTLA